MSNSLIPAFNQIRLTNSFVSVSGERLKVTDDNTLMVRDSGNFANIQALTSLSGRLVASGAILSAVSVTGSTIMQVVNFTGMGGTLVIQSGNFVLISGSRSLAGVDHGHGINLSGNLFTTGATLIARDLATSGELSSRLIQTGRSAWDNATNLSGNLNASGRRAWDDATNLSGRLVASGAILSAVSVTGSSIMQVVNFTGMGGTLVIQSGNFVLISGAGSRNYDDGINLSGRLTATGSLLVSNDLNLSGSINASGRRAWDDATNLSGNLTTTGQTLVNLINGLSGQLNANNYISYINATGFVTGVIAGSDYQYINFPRTFSRIPMVQLTMDNLDTGNIYYFCGTSKRTTTGFFANFSDIVLETGIFLSVWAAI